MDDYDVDAILQQALDRLTVLADINAALAGTLEMAEGMRRVARIVAHRLGDWCAVDLLTGDGRIERVCVARTEAGPQPQEELAFLTLPPESATGPLARVLRGAGPLLLAGADLTPGAAIPGMRCRLVTSVALPARSSLRCGPGGRSLVS
ncbi:hypothetical protein ACFVVP_26820 [Streptomyces sp. NPDC058128]|uniref:hypothetical protein n=1 Tax=Streptomyces sp. NPDC058128 TaxID=3346352 RepID=UPI0036E901ED